MEVSRSGFYGHLGRRRSNAQTEREALEGFAVEAFERRRGRYGYRRIDRELRNSGISVSEKRALRTMRKLGLAGKVAIDAIGRAVGGEGPPDDGKPRLPWRPRRAARLPLLPAMPGLAWRSPVGIEARHAAGQRGGRVVPRDAEKGIGGREELWDEGCGQAGHLQVHRALLQ